MRQESARFADGLTTSRAERQWLNACPPGDPRGEELVQTPRGRRETMSLQNRMESRLSTGTGTDGTEDKAAQVLRAMYESRLLLWIFQ